MITDIQTRIVELFQPKPLITGNIKNAVIWFLFGFILGGLLMSRIIEIQNQNKKIETKENFINDTPIYHQLKKEMNLKWDK